MRQDSSTRPLGAAGPRLRSRLATALVACASVAGLAGVAAAQSARPSLPVVVTNAPEVSISGTPPVTIEGVPEATVSNLADDPIPVSLEPSSGEAVTIRRQLLEDLTAVYDVPDEKALVVDFFSAQIQTEVDLCDDVQQADGVALNLFLTSTATDTNAGGAIFFLGTAPLSLSPSSPGVGFWRFSRSIPGLHRGRVTAFATIRNDSPCRIGGMADDTFANYSSVGRLVDLE